MYRAARRLNILREQVGSKLWGIQDEFEEAGALNQENKKPGSSRQQLIISAWLGIVTEPSLEPNQPAPLFVLSDCCGFATMTLVLVCLKSSRGTQSCTKYWACHCSGMRVAAPSLIDGATEPESKSRETKEYHQPVNDNWPTICSDQTSGLIFVPKRSQRKVH